MKSKINYWAVWLADMLEKIIAVPLIIIGFLMVVVVLIGTFWRYVLRNPFIWTEELARYLMIWMALVAASISLKRREHVGLKLIINRVPQPAKKITVIITQLFMLLFLYYLTKEGFAMAERAKLQNSPALNISMFWPLLSVPIAGLLTGIQLILQMIIDLTVEEER